MSRCHKVAGSVVTYAAKFCGCFLHGSSPLLSVFTMKTSALKRGFCTSILLYNLF